jgi:hypothetical protein
MSSVNENIPKRIFIVPYRNRIQHKFFFSNQMSFLLEKETDYEIYFVHQNDPRPFNRGAMKNIGFIAMKQKYPDHYKDITFIFNDVDTVPFHKLFDYQTERGTVAHYYGFETALGGIVVIKGADFELINGYPTYWGWGMEDACLQKRCLFYKLKIDRSHFFPIGSPEILQLFDGVSRLVCAKDPERMRTDNGQDGLKIIHRLAYTIDKESANPLDNVYTVNNDKIGVINVQLFMNMTNYETDKYHDYDLRDPIDKVVFPKTLTNTLNFVNKTEDWKKIPSMPHFNPEQKQLLPPTPAKQQKVAGAKFRLRI